MLLVIVSPIFPEMVSAEVNVMLATRFSVVKPAMLLESAENEATST